MSAHQSISGGTVPHVPAETAHNSTSQPLDMLKCQPSNSSVPFDLNPNTIDLISLHLSPHNVAAGTDLSTYSLDGKISKLHGERRSCHGRSYVCRFCGKEYQSMSGLSKHMHVHGEGRTYNCDICQRTFTQNSSRKRHMILFHGLAKTE